MGTTCPRVGNIICPRGGGTVRVFDTSSGLGTALDMCEEEEREEPLARLPVTGFGLVKRCWG